MVGEVCTEGFTGLYGGFERATYYNSRNITLLCQYLYLFPCIFSCQKTLVKNNDSESSSMQCVQLASSFTRGKIIVLWILPMRILLLSVGNSVRGGLLIRGKKE